jgi:hypothetical protein
MNRLGKIMKDKWKGSRINYDVLGIKPEKTEERYDD